MRIAHHRSLLALVAALGCDSGAIPADNCGSKSASANLVPNGTFDRGAEGWTADPAGGATAAEDAAGCSASHSLALTTVAAADGAVLYGQSISNCFALPVAPRMSFGAMMKRIEGASVSCYLTVWKDTAACEQRAEGGERLDSIDNGLSPVGEWDSVSVQLDASAGALGRVTCRTDGRGYVDEVFVTSGAF